MEATSRSKVSRGTAAHLASASRSKKLTHSHPLSDVTALTIDDRRYGRIVYRQVYKSHRTAIEQVDGTTCRVHATKDERRTTKIGSSFVVRPSKNVVGTS